MVKLDYKMFGARKAHRETLRLEDIGAFNKMLSAHVTSLTATVWANDLSFSIPLVSNGLVRDSTYNNKVSIMELINNPQMYNEGIQYPFDIHKEDIASG